MCVQVDQAVKMTGVQIQRRFRLPAILSSLLLLASCQRQPTDNFQLFEEDYFNALFKWTPSFGTLSGFHEWDSKLEDYSAEAHQGRITELRALKERDRKSTRLNSSHRH